MDHCLTYHRKHSHVQLPSDSGRFLFSVLESEGVPREEFCRIIMLLVVELLFLQVVCYQRVWLRGLMRNPVLLHVVLMHRSRFAEEMAREIMPNIPPNDPFSQAR